MGSNGLTGVFIYAILLYLRGGEHELLDKLQRIHVTSNPDEINVRDSCELKDIAEWLGAKYEETETSFKAVIAEGDPARRIRLVWHKATPGIINIYAARLSVLEMSITLENIVRFVFQKQKIQDRTKTEEIKQVIFRTRKGAQLIIDDKGYVSFSG